MREKKENKMSMYVSPELKENIENFARDYLQESFSFDSLDEEEKQRLAQKVADLVYEDVYKPKIMTQQIYNCFKNRSFHSGDTIQINFSYEFSMETLQAILWDVDSELRKEEQEKKENKKIKNVEIKIENKIRLIRKKCNE